jgi:hypothetical protein
MRARSLIAVAVLIAAGATACGSSSKSPAAVGATGTTTGSTSPAASGAPGGAPTTIKLSGSSGSNFCQLARSDQAAFSGPDLTNGSADLKKEFQNLGKALQDAANEAPSAIKGDFETFITAFKPYLQALAAANYDPTKLNTAALKSLSSTQVDTASQHIEQYFEQVCHITPPTT